MKKILLFVFALTITITSAQDLIKVKGNREVTTEISPIDSFETLEISEDYEITLVPGSSSQVEITTDSNLHQYLAVSVVGGKLVVTTTARIRSKKEMKFRIVYGPELKKITVKGDTQLSSLTSLAFEDLELNIEEDAKVFITANVTRLILNAERSTTSELNLSGKKAVINLKDNADVAALIKYDYLELSMKDRVDAKIEGDINNGQLNLSSRANIEGKNLVFDDLDLTIKNYATAEINVKGKLTLHSSDEGDVTLHNTPKIDMKNFSGKSVLEKQ